MVRICSIAPRSVDAVLASWGHQTGSVLLDSGGDITQRSRWCFFTSAPRHILTVTSPTRIAFDGKETNVSEITTCFDVMRKVENRYKKTTKRNDIPFCGGWIGFASYQFGQIVQKLPFPLRHQQDFLFWSGFYDHVFIWDRKYKKHYLCVLGDDEQSYNKEKTWLQAWENLPHKVHKKPFFPALILKPCYNKATYCQKIEQTREYIANGAIFQANITQQYRGHINEDFPIIDLYRIQRKAIPAPFGAFLNCSSYHQILSSSPESFLHLSHARVMSTRPIKGTICRSADRREDEKLKKHLQQDEKERAENLMIVDLMRNDLGRLAKYGSMDVPQLRVVETFSHVHHLVSEVRGILKARQDGYDLLCQTLPPGSVTGAPKIEAMKIIDRIEDYARGAYCGTIFCQSVTGELTSSVIIRTLERHHQTLSMGTGGGITFLSDPIKEYEEMQLKWQSFNNLLARKCQ